MNAGKGRLWVVVLWGWGVAGLDAGAGLSACKLKSLAGQPRTLGWYYLCGAAHKKNEQKRGFPCSACPPAVRVGVGKLTGRL